MTHKRFVAPATEPTIKSKVELEWLHQGADVISREYGQPVVWTMYEPFKLKLGKAWYRVDFAHLLEDGRLVLVETKESHYQPNYRDSMTRVKVAQGVFFFFDFIVALPMPKKNGGGWSINHLAQDERKATDNE